jgi:PKD repeat protein
VGTPTAPVTYTITNTGGATAEGVSISSDSPEFVYNNDISSTTIAPSGSATFTVTFTPAAGGTRNATLTGSSTSVGSNSPTYPISGTGVAAPVATIPGSVGTGSSTICVNQTYTLLAGEAESANGTISWTHNGAGSITNGSTLTPTYTPAAGDAGNTVTLTLHVSNASCTEATDTYTIIVNATPTLFTVSGPPSGCSGTSVNISLSGSVSGVSYQLRSGTTPVGSAVAGTGNPLTLPTDNLVSTTTYNVLATDNTTNCSIQMTGTATVTVISAPVANFSGVPTTVTQGGSVVFTDASTQSPTSWSWSFPGGTPSSSTIQNPTITYNTPGTYSVTLVSTNACGFDDEVKTNYITVNALAGCTPQTVWTEAFTYSNNTITGTGTPAPGSTVTGSWTAEFESPDDGVYVNTNQLRFEDADGGANDDFDLTLNVAGYTNVVISIPYTSTSVATGDQLVFSYSVNGGAFTSFFTESGSGSGTVTFPTINGATTIAINIDANVDAEGTFYSIDNISVSAIKPPTVNDPTDQTVCTGSSTAAVNFTGTATAFLWTNNNTSIGLAASGAGNIPSFTATNSGSTQQVATITVTPSDGSCAGTPQTFTITVDPTITQPDPFTASTSFVCQGQSNVAYTVPNVANVTYNWSYSGTGATITGTTNSVLVSFSASATSGNLSVTATNSCGTSAPRTIAITVEGTTPVVVSGGGSACVSATLNATGGVGGTIYFQGTTSGGTSTAIPSSSQVITTSGTYYFRAQSPGGCWGPEGSATVTILTPPTATGVTICQGSTAQNLTATSACTTTSQTSQTFNANGTFTAPATIISAVVEAWGGGGGGGSDATNNNGNAGGGGGAYASSHLTSATLTPGNYTVVVGTGGGQAVAGGASSFGAVGPNRVEALGGGSSTTSLTGGPGGSGPSSTGNFFKATGGTGGIGSGATTGTGGGGGGSSANAAGDGTNGNTFSGTTGGAGGNSPGMVDPQGNGGNGGNNGVTNGATAGTAPGGGGGGRGDNGGNSASGAPGRVVVTYTFGVADTYSWFTAASGGTAVEVTSSTTFNPIGDAQVIASGAPYSSLTNTNTPGTYQFWVACSSNPTCRTQVDYIIEAAPNPAIAYDFDTQDGGTRPTPLLCSDEVIDVYANNLGALSVATWEVVPSTAGTISLITNNHITFAPNTSAPATVDIKFTTTVPASPSVCGAVTRTLTVTVNQAPVVDAGTDQTICSNSYAQLAGDQECNSRNCDVVSIFRSFPPFNAI